MKDFLFRFLCSIESINLLLTWNVAAKRFTTFWTCASLNLMWGFFEPAIKQFNQFGVDKHCASHKRDIISFIFQVNARENPCASSFISGFESRRAAPSPSFVVSWPKKTSYNPPPSGHRLYFFKNCTITQRVTGYARALAISHLTRISFCFRCLGGSTGRKAVKASFFQMKNTTWPVAEKNSSFNIRVAVFFCWSFFLGG